MKPTKHRATILFPSCALILLSLLLQEEISFGQAPLIGNIISTKDATFSNSFLGRQTRPLITISPNEVPGKMILKFLDPPTSSTDWSFSIRVGATNLTITNNNYLDYQVTPEQIGIPLDSSSHGELSIEFSGPAPSINYDALVKYHFDGAALNVNGAPNLMYFDQDFSNDPTRKQIARAIVRLEFWTFVGTKSCTAFQFSKGYFLTNLHCIEDEDRDPIRHPINTLVFGATKNQIMGESQTTADVIFRPASAARTGSALDFAVLKAHSVPPNYANAILQFASGNPLPPSEGDQLEIYQQWMGDQGLPGKTLSMDSQCVVIKPHPMCPPPNIRHGCDTESGSSGSPVVRRGQTQVIALHHTGLGKDQGNCALPIDKIKADFTDKQLAIPTE